MAHTVTDGRQELVTRDQTKTGSYDDDVVSYETLQRDRYGGINLGASFFGWLVAAGLTALLTGLLAAVGGAAAIDSLNGIVAINSETVQTVGIVSAIGLVLAMAVAYYSGGYVAGRMSRFDGARQGLGVWSVGLIVMILLGVTAAVLGTRYNLLQNLNLPALPVEGATLTTTGLILAIVSLAVMLIAAVTGGKFGERYHHKVDAVGRN